MKPTSEPHKVASPAGKKMPDERTIESWMRVFGKLYGRVDANRTPAGMWIAATAHFTTIGEAIRSMHFADLMQGAAHAFCWMCSFVLACQKAKGTVFFLDETFSALVASKYPLVCGHCQEAYCHCNPQLMDRTKNKAAKYKELLKLRTQLSGAYENYGVSEWLDIFGKIYGQNIHNLTLESIGFHFIEEAGEELTAIRNLLQLESAPNQVKGLDKSFLNELSTYKGVLDQYDKYVTMEPDPHKRDPESIKARLVHAKVNMFIEFADTFSWFCSILNKVTSIARNCNDDKNREHEECFFTEHPFREKLSQEYLPKGRARCPSCKKCPCNCVFYG
jgi:hypothetical protein